MSAANDQARDPPLAGPEPPQSSPVGGTRTGAEERATPAAKGATPGANVDEDEWRHEPIAPVDERNPLKSLGRAIADVAASGSEPAPKPRDR